MAVRAEGASLGVRLTLIWCRPAAEKGGIVPDHEERPDIRHPWRRCRALYWLFAVHAGTSVLAIGWTTGGRLVVGYAAGGFVVGAVLGFAYDMVLGDK